MSKLSYNVAPEGHHLSSRIKPYTKLSPIGATPRDGFCRPATAELLRRDLTTLRIAAPLKVVKSTCVPANCIYKFSFTRLSHSSFSVPEGMVLPARRYQ